MDFDRSTPVSVSDFMAAARGKSPVWWKIGKSEKKQIQEMLEDMNCAYLADRRLGALSGGELQRVLLALATILYRICSFWTNLFPVWIWQGWICFTIG